MLDTAGRLGCFSKRGHSQHCDKDLGSQKNISFLWHLKRRCWLNIWNVTPNWQRGPLWLNDLWSLYSEGCKHPLSWKKQNKKNNVNICDSVTTSVGQEWLHSVFIYALQSGAPSVFVLELYTVCCGSARPILSFFCIENNFLPKLSEFPTGATPSPVFVFWSVSVFVHSTNIRDDC